MESQRISISFTLNDVPVTIAVLEHWTLLQLLRDGLNAFEVKDGCSQGDCGACAVLLNGVAVNSCLVLAAQVKGCTVTTVRGLSANPITEPLMDAFVTSGGTQCGFCTPGMLVVGAELLTTTLQPTRDEIRSHISGNLCRCTGYTKIVDAIDSAAQLATTREKV